MRRHGEQNRARLILEMLINEYRAHPERIDQCLPEVARELKPLLPKRRGNSPLSLLTEPERERLGAALTELLAMQRRSPADSIRTLEYCATFIQDATLPPEVDRAAILALLYEVTGTRLSKIRKATKISVRGGEATKEVAILRGVHLHLSWKDELVAISVSPQRSNERSKGLGFVGIGKDTSPDVAERHDAYLAEALSNAVP